MKKDYTVLVADRNPYVRNLILRELRAEGYQVLLAKNGPEIIELVYRGRPIDLLILDLDIPSIEETSLIVKLKDWSPFLPVVVHSFLSDYETYREMLNPADFVKKERNSVDHLKRSISDILKQSDKHPAPS